MALSTIVICFRLIEALELYTTIADFTGHTKIILCGVNNDICVKIFNQDIQGATQGKSYRANLIFPKRVYH